MNNSHLLFLCCLALLSSTSSAMRLASSATRRHWSTQSTFETTWSRPTSTTIASSTTAASSRFGVRKRIKSVLEKAKQRTGVANDHTEYYTSSDTFTIADPNIYNSNNYYAGEAISYTAVSNVTDAPLPKVNNNNNVKKIASEANNNLNNRNSNNKINTAVAPPPAKQAKPFVLPQLTSAQRQALLNDERVQEQSKMGNEGSGYVVFDVKAPPEAVWECLLDFEAYPENIGTVRSMRISSNSSGKRLYGVPSTTRASFCLSKFQLQIAAVHQYQGDDYMVFTLDKSCTNMVLQDAKGIWYTETNPDGRGEEYTRVWLLCQVKVSSILPKFIVDYTAKRAMPRATTWLRPLVEERLNNKRVL